MPRKADGKPKGRMSSYAFFVKICREEHQKKHPGENVVFTEFSRKCSEKWKEMNAKEKSRFEEMAGKDKIRYDREMSTYTPTGDVGPKGRKRKQKKDPYAPKRALSAFFFFCGEERPAIRKEHPDYSVGDVAKELGKMWGEVKDKTMYDTMAQKDKKRYEVEKQAYEKGGRVQQSPAKKVKVAEPEEEDDEEEDDEEEDDDDDDDA